MEKGILAKLNSALTRLDTLTHREFPTTGGPKIDPDIL